MKDIRQVILGEKYVIQVVAVVGPVVAECVCPPTIDGVWCTEWPHLRVLTKGMLRDTVLKGGDYFLVDVYDPEKHGPIP